MMSLAQRMMRWLRERESVGLDGRPKDAGVRVYLVPVTRRHVVELRVRVQVRPAGGRACWWRAPEEEEVCGTLRALLEATEEVDDGQETGRTGWLNEWERRRESMMSTGRYGEEEVGK